MNLIMPYKWAKLTQILRILSKYINIKKDRFKVVLSSAGLPISMITVNRNDLSVIADAPNTELLLKKIRDIIMKPKFNIKNIGFIGLGVMGMPMCINLSKNKKFNVSGFDKNEDKNKMLSKLGLKTTLNPIEIYEKNVMISKKEYSEQFNYQNLSKKFELNNYENEIRSNIYNKMVSKILIDLANLKWF